MSHPCCPQLITETSFPLSTAATFLFGVGGYAFKVMEPEWCDVETCWWHSPLPNEGLSETKRLNDRKTGSRDGVTRAVTGRGRRGD